MITDRFSVRVSLFACLWIGTIVAGCSPSTAVPTKDDERKEQKTEDGKLKVSDFIADYRLAWADDFNGTALDASKWKYRAEGSVRGHATVSGAETIAPDGKGNLVIRTVKKDGKYYVGQAATDGLFAQKFGYFECRAQMQQHLGTHSAFWLQTNTVGIETDSPKTNGTEIDIFEYHRKTSNQVHHNLHWNGYGNAHRHVGTTRTIPFIGTGFHTFGLLWTATEYIFFVDGEETWRTKEAVSHVPEYLILSTELTGFGGEHRHENYPDSVVFDYVKVYEPI